RQRAARARPSPANRGGRPSGGDAARRANGERRAPPAATARSCHLPNAVSDAGALARAAIAVYRPAGQRLERLRVAKRIVARSQLRPA
nr:hypothetical protein [Caldimonas sp.]